MSLHRVHLSFETLTGRSLANMIENDGYPLCVTGTFKGGESKEINNKQTNKQKLTVEVIHILRIIWLFEATPENLCGILQCKPHHV